MVNPYRLRQKNGSRKRALRHQALFFALLNPRSQLVRTNRTMEATHSLFLMCSAVIVRFPVSLHGKRRWREIFAHFSPPQLSPGLPSLTEPSAILRCVVPEQER